MSTCKTCLFFSPLSPGGAAICFERWRHLPWNAAVPLTGPDDGCAEHQANARHATLAAQEK